MTWQEAQALSAALRDWRRASRAQRWRWNGKTPTHQQDAFYDNLIDTHTELAEMP